MLRKIASSELKENMRFSAPVFFDDGVYMLVDEGIPLRQRELDALERWDIPFVLTEGTELKENMATGAPKKAGEAAKTGIELTASFGVPGAAKAAIKPPASFGAPEGARPEFDEFRKFNWDEEDSSGAQMSAASKAKDVDMNKVHEKRKALAEVFPDGRIDRLPPSLRNAPQYASYESVIVSLDEFFADMKNSDSVKPRAIDSIVNNLRLLVLDDQAYAVRYIFGNDVSEREMAKNAVHTAIISMIVAESRLVSEAAIERMLTGALLHDVGMLRVPDKIIEKTGKLSDGELAIVRSHPGYGYKIIVDDLMYPDEAALAAAQHHEHWDGSGYPAGLEGEKISIQARIVSAADAFVAMVSSRSYRLKLSGYEAMKNLVADNARRFDPDIVKAMIQNIGIYPVGSLVLLNNAAIARVVQVFPGMPLRPVVKILINDEGQAFSDDDSESVDLRANKGLFIVRAVNPAEI